MIGPRVRAPDARDSIQIGDRVRFSYSTPSRGRVWFEGPVVRWRKDRGSVMGWLDVRCADGIERSVRPNSAERVS